MDVLNLFTTWLFNTWSQITSVVFTQFGFLGSALFSLILIRKLVKIFKHSY